MTRSFGTKPPRGRARGRLRGRSGQAMTEAVITLCLLSFTWLVTAYLLTLAEKRVRSAAIGRHAAWQQAHNPNAFFNPATTLTPFFLRHQGTVTPSGTPSSRTVDANQANLEAGVLSVLNELSLRTIRIQHVEQRLNINNRDDRLIYLVDQREVPLMQEAFVGINSVGVATCEWANVQDLLENRQAVQNALLK